MILWINGAFGSGKSTTAYELNRRLPHSFVYDPENVGYFIRRNTNGLFSKGDFQDIPLWREMNYKILDMTANKYEGVIIIPMTLVDKTYYGEIIEKLISDGHTVKHYILYTERDEIRRRIKKRTLPFFGDDTFAQSNVDRCMDAFERDITETKIHTDGMTVDQVVEEIARLSSLSFQKGRKTKLGRLLYRLKTTLKHIR